MDIQIKKYSHLVLFYTLSTVIPWAFWFAAAYISHLSPTKEAYTDTASLLGFTGLISPMIVAFWLMKKDGLLDHDLFPRFFNLKNTKPIYLFLTIFLMPGSILLAQLVSLLFGYSSSQFEITGHYTFTSGVFPVWFLLIVAPVIEELAWHTYGTDALRSRFSLLSHPLVKTMHFSARL